MSSQLVVWDQLYPDQSGTAASEDWEVDTDVWSWGEKKKKEQRYLWNSNRTGQWYTAHNPFSTQS